MTSTIDKAAPTVVKADRDTPSVRAVGFLAEIADQPQVIATSVGTAVIGLVARRPDLVRGGVRMFAAQAAATFVTSAIRSAMEAGRADLEPGHAQTSFPSGHSAGAAARPLKGKHHLSDVVVGVAVGWVAEALVSAVFDRGARRGRQAVRKDGSFSHPVTDGGTVTPP